MFMFENRSVIDELVINNNLNHTLSYIKIYILYFINHAFKKITNTIISDVYVYYKTFVDCLLLRTMFCHLLHHTIFLSRK